MLHFLQGNDLFNQHKNKDAIKNILAILIIDVVNADGISSPKEQTTILKFYKQEFKMDETETIALFNSVEDNDPELLASLSKLKEIFNDEPTAKAKVLEHLNSVILCDGCTDAEYHIFEKIKTFLMAN